MKTYSQKATLKPKNEHDEYLTENLYNKITSSIIKSNIMTSTNIEASSISQTNSRPTHPKKVNMSVMEQKSQCIEATSISSKLCHTI